LALPLAAEPVPEAAALPDRDAFGAAVAPGKPHHSQIKKLYAAIAGLDPNAEQGARVAALEELFRWLRSSRSIPTPPGTVPGESAYIQRIRLIVHAARTMPGVAARIAGTMVATLEQCQGGGLFAKLGLPSERGLWTETVDRLSRRMLPEPRDDRDLLQIVSRLLPKSRERNVMASLPAELFGELLHVLGAGTWRPLERMRSEAIALVAMRIAATGLSDVLRARSLEGPLEHSPFYRLPRAIETARQAIGDGDAYVAALSECRTIADECRAVTARVIENLEHSGVSVDVVYRLELITLNLTRLERLLASFEPASDLDRALRSKHFLVDLLEARLVDHQLRDILGDNLHLLARKIIERAGHTGEHYITSSRGEYLKMLLSAGGGGILTAGTCAFKFLTGWLKAPPFVEGFLNAVNYSGSFVTMQFLGFTLATKQPSVTAAALAGTLRETAGHPDLGRLVSLIARITRSQLAAAMGNIGLVIPAALIFDWIWRMKHGGEHFLDADTAAYALGSLHPTRTGTIFFAALTGVLLWASSLAAGWLENWAVYRRLPEAIEHHPMGRFVGRRTMAWLSRVFSRNVSGIGGNVSLGTLLAMTPIAGKFFGLPLDVRHVTLSTGALTLAVSSLGRSAALGDVIGAAIGILIIGSLNFGVSFVLALAVALRARQVERSDRWRLVVSLFATFLKSPFQFVFPPRDPEASPVHGPVSIRPPAAH
jgi:site-specific recombinase